MQQTSQVITRQSVQESGEMQYHQFSFPAPGSAQSVSVSLGYRRSTDFDHANQPGQDYAIVRGGHGFVVGVVADGVSQSFYGHLAARFVAGHLLEFLWERRETPPPANQLNRALRGFELDFKAGIDGYPLPERLQPVHRAALEKTRERSGSQAVFAAFVLNAETRSLRLFEVGDALAVVHCARDETNGSHSKVIQADRRGRWSSAGRTELLLEEVNEQHVKGVVIKSDGAKDWGASLARHKFNQAAFFELAPECSSYDDVSFVAAVFQDESSDTIPAGAEAGARLASPSPPPPSIPADPRPQPPRPSPQPPLTNDPVLVPYSVHPATPAKWRRDWAMFALGSGASGFLAALGLFGLVWSEVITLKMRAPDCKIILSQNQVTVEAANTTRDLKFTAAKKCQWSVVNVPPWIKLTSSSEGSGDGHIAFSIDQNTGPEREEEIEINGNKFWVKQQAGCVYQLKPESGSFSARGGKDRFQVKTETGCPWKASTEQSWIKIETGGDGEVAYAVEPSREPAREGLIKIGATSFKIRQVSAEQKPAQKQAAGSGATPKKTETTKPPGTSPERRQPEKNN